MKQKIASPFLVIYEILFALSSSVVASIALSWPLLWVFVLVQKSNELVNLSVMRLMHNYNQLLWYLIWPFQNKLKMDDLPTSANAAQHFADCKRLFLLAILVFIICLAIYLFNRKSYSFRLGKEWSLTLAILPLLVLPVALTNFDRFFIMFHHLLFTNSNWLFNPATDPIINVLTEGFFAACFVAAGLVYEAFFASQLLKQKRIP